jgi:hypothetical protein
MTHNRLTHASFWLIALCGMAALVTSSTLLAMGTPPQKPAQSPVDPNSNAVMLKADDLRAAPDVGANVLARLDKGARVRLLATQGGWRQISGAGKTGWVRVLSISADAANGGGLADLEALGKTPQGKVVAVAGVRGLSEETLRTAVYSESELQILAGYAMSRAEAEQYAQAAGLRVRALPYLDAVIKSQKSSSDSSWKDN